MLRLVKLLLLAALNVLFLMGLYNLYELVDKQVLLQTKADWRRLTISVNQAAPFASEDTDEQEDTASNAYTYDEKQHELCLRTRSGRNCGHVSFRIDRSLPAFLTADYLVLQNEFEFLVVERNHPAKEHHLQHFTKAKETHLKHAHPHQLKFHTFPTSNLFVYESDRLYITYLIEERNIQTCLFLEKVAPTYVQHIFPRDDSTMVVVSLPKRRQIMAQLFNFRDRRVVQMKKFALDDWIKNYSIREKARPEGKVLIVELEMAAGAYLTYSVDYQTLAMTEEKRQAKFSAKMSGLELRSQTITINSRLKSIVLSELQSFFTTIINKIKSLTDPQFVAEFDARYKPTLPIGAPVKFTKGNRLVDCPQFAIECNVVSLGKYLLPTNTPVFYDNELGDFEQINKDELTPQRFMYLQDGAFHSEEYSLLYQIHPKMEVEWVGLTKAHIHFYPYNVQSKHYRYARIRTGGLVFQGSQVKGRWEGARSSTEVYQQINSEASEVATGIYEAHAYWYGMFADIVTVGGKAVKVRVLNGFNGKQLRVFTLRGDYTIDNVYVTFVNNELFICLYDPQTDRSLVTKIEFYTSPESQNQEPELMELQREYTIYSKILQLRKVKSSYYLLTFSRKRLSVLIVGDRVLSNRRLNLYQKHPTPLEKKLTAASGYQPFDNILDLYGVVMEYNQTLERISLFEEELSRRVLCVLKETNSEVYLIGDINYIVKNRMIKYRYEMRFFISVIAVVLFPLAMAVVYANRRKRLAALKKESSDTREEPKNDASTSSGKPSRTKKQ